MTKLTETEAADLRRLYSEACHGHGADARWSARGKLQEMLEAAGITLKEALESQGLCIRCYFASRPIL